MEKPQGRNLIEGKEIRRMIMKRAILFICSVLFLSGCTDLFHKEDLNKSLQLININAENANNAIILDWQNPDNNYLQKIEIKYAPLETPDAIIDTITIFQGKLKPKARVSKRAGNLINGKQYIFYIKTYDMFGKSNSEEPLIYFAGNGCLTGEAKHGDEQGKPYICSHTDDTGRIKIDGTICEYSEQMIIIPRGQNALIAMTDDSSWSDYLEDEDDYWGAYPKGRKIKLGAFSLGRYEITRDFYKKVMTGNPLNLSTDPIYTININGETTKYKAMSVEAYGVHHHTLCYFCNLLSKKTGLIPYYEISNPVIACDTCEGRKFYYISSATISKNTEEGAEYGWRLPTLAEWEYAYRGGNPNKIIWTYPYSNVPAASKPLKRIDANLNEIAWYSNNSSYDLCHQVGKKKPNSLNLYDMNGNASEMLSGFKYSNMKQNYEYEKIFEQNGFITDPIVFGPVYFTVGLGYDWPANYFINESDFGCLRLCRSM